MSSDITQDYMVSFWDQMKAEAARLGNGHGAPSPSVTHAYTIGIEAVYDQKLSNGGLHKASKDWAWQTRELAETFIRVGVIPGIDQSWLAGFAIYEMELPGTWKAAVEELPVAGGFFLLRVNARVTRKVIDSNGKKKVG